jgi:hypothetical protein
MLGQTGNWLLRGRYVSLLSLRRGRCGLFAFDRSLQGISICRNQAPQLPRKQSHNKRQEDQTEDEGKTGQCITRRQQGDKPDRTEGGDRQRHPHQRRFLNMNLDRVSGIQVRSATLAIFRFVTSFDTTRRTEHRFISSWDVSREIYRTAIGLKVKPAVEPLILLVQAM